MYFSKTDFPKMFFNFLLMTEQLIRFPSIIHPSDRSQIVCKSSSDATLARWTAVRLYNILYIPQVRLKTATFGRYRDFFLKIKKCYYIVSFIRTQQQTHRNNYGVEVVIHCHVLVNHLFEIRLCDRIVRVWKKCINYKRNRPDCAHMKK